MRFVRVMAFLVCSIYLIYDGRLGIALNVLQMFVVCLLHIADLYGW